MLLFFTQSRHMFTRGGEFIPPLEVKKLETETEIDKEQKIRYLQFFVQFFVAFDIKTTNKPQTLYI